jgi:hypothetical protein
LAGTYSTHGREEERDHFEDLGIWEDNIKMDLE